MIRTILASLTGLNGDSAVLDTAAAAAALDGAHIDALHVHLGTREVLELAAAGALPHSVAMTKVASDLERSESARTARARAAFQVACTRHNIPVFDDPAKQNGRSARWLDVESISIYETGRRAQHYDMTVLAREAQLPMERLPDILMRSGRPALIAPARPPATLGRTVAIAWKPTAEASHALIAAGPFLPHARKVVVIAVPEEGTAADLPARLDELKQTLRWTGIDLETHLTGPVSDVAGAIREAAYNLDADLLVMGAYGHSRLREFVFGGVTRSMLASCDIPVLMFH